MKNVLIGAFAMLLAGCGSGSPTSPTAPATPTATSITVIGLDAIRSGFFANFVAAANMSNGTTQAATNVTWTSDDPSIATVGANGEVGGIANGSATIAATVNGMRGSKSVRIVSNFGGDWSGAYQVAKCDDAGSFHQLGWCAGLGGPAAVLPMSLSLTQFGPGRDQIGGTLILGNVGGNITGTSPETGA